MNTGPFPIALALDADCRSVCRHIGRIYAAHLPDTNAGRKEQSHGDIVLARVVRLRALALIAEQQGDFTSRARAWQAFGYPDCDIRALERRAL